MHPCSLEDVIIPTLNIKNSKYVVNRNLYLQHYVRWQIIQSMQ